MTDHERTFQTMAAKGSRWCDAEVECLLQIWSDENIQEQLDRSHKNSEVYGKIRDHLQHNGYIRSIDQCRDKVKKLRSQYLRIRHTLRRSGSSTEDKEKFPWYDAVDQTMALKPCTEPEDLESTSGADGEQTSPSKMDRRRDHAQAFKTMAGKGLRWCDAEVECLLKIWSDDNIQEQLDKMHKNSEVYGKIRDHLQNNGYIRSIDQCRDKVKKLRSQYLRIRHMLRRSGSSAQAEKFPWYDAVDQTMALKPSTEPEDLESTSWAIGHTTACMTRNEVHDFVKLRVSNNYLFSGRRNATMRAWRAILKQMGWQHKMSYVQASKKWEHMKKRYKDLKYPSNGVKVYPEGWPYFNLMDDALEGRLEGSAPILTALPTNSDLSPTSKPNSIVINSVTSLAGRPEIEVTLNGDEDEEPVKEERSQEIDSMQETEHDMPETEHDMSEVEDNMSEVEDDMSEIEQDMPEMEHDRNSMDSDREVMERERLVLQRERAVLEREFAALDRDRALLERERATMEREKAVMDRERAVLEEDRDAVRKERLTLEQDKARLERLKERTEEVTEDGGEVNNSNVLDRKERFLNLFEKLIENF